MSDRASASPRSINSFEYASPRTISQALEEVESDPDVIAQAMTAAEQTPVGVGASQTAGTPARRVPLQPDVQVIRRASGSSSGSSSSRRRRCTQSTPPGPNPPTPAARPRLTTPAGQRQAQKRPRRPFFRAAAPSPSPSDGGSSSSSSSSSGGQSAANRSATQNLSPSDLSEAFNRLTQRERERMAREKRNVQSVTHTSTFTTVFKKGRAPQVVRQSTRVTPGRAAPPQHPVQV